MKRELIFFVSVIFFGIAAYIYSFWEKEEIDRDGYYVLAKVETIYDTENGLLYDFRYSFKKKMYHGGLKGAIRMKDSLIILKISRTRPELWQISDSKVPACLTVDSMNKYWEHIPFCISNRE